jgi:hypothetical protein
MIQKQTKIINAQILNIINKANSDIQLIEGIYKYQEFFGKVIVCSHTDDSESIKRRFHKNWFRLDNTIPKWSHPLIYNIAVKHSELSSYGSFRQPEDFAAADFAKETIKQLEQSINNKD